MGLRNTERNGGRRRGRGIYIYEGRGESVIDYVIGEEKVRRRVAGMEVGDCIESDHHPLVVLLERKGGKARGKKQGNKEDIGGR